MDPDPKQIETVESETKENRLEVSMPGQTDLALLPSSGLLSFYDRLRRRMVRFIEAKGGKLGHEASTALLFVPDIFIFLARLSIDREVPASTRAMIGGALAYFVLPADLLPELVLGPAGYLDDLILSVLLLSHAFGEELEPPAAKHWSGSKTLHRVLQDVLQSASRLVGNNLYDRLHRLLAKQGIDLEIPIAAASDEKSGDAPEVSH
jgi:uncharacterized membrane protein YkvA (DUF1232 family)